MRRSALGICHVAASLIFGFAGLVQAQGLPSEGQPLWTCVNDVADEESPTGPAISVAEVNFPRALQLPLAEQAGIANSVNNVTFTNPLEDAINEGIERIKNGWQDRGYFKAEVTGTAKVMTSSPVNQRIALTVEIVEGLQYRLASIVFKNGHVFDPAALRGFFPIEDGEIFSREKIGKGLENLRRGYGNQGFVNLTSVPETKFDDGNRLISLVVDLDEGKRFRVGRVSVLGMDRPTAEKVLRTSGLKPGEIFDSSQWASLLVLEASHPHCDCPDQQRSHYDDKLGIVDLTFDFRPCSSN